MRISYRNITLPLEGEPYVHVQIRAPFEHGTMQYLLKVDINGKNYVLEKEIVESVPTLASLATKAASGTPVYLSGDDEANTICLYHAIASYIHEHMDEDEHVWSVYENGFRLYSAEQVQTLIATATQLGMQTFVESLRALYKAKTGRESL